MRLWASIALALALSGCALLRHDAVVRGVFPPDEAEAWAGAVPVGEAWAQ